QSMDRLAKLGSFLSPTDVNQASDSPGVFVGPLVGQNRYYVRYEIRFNRIAFEHIKRYKLHKKEFQPSNGQVPIGFPAGSIVVKAAWRVIVPEYQFLHIDPASRAEERKSEAYRI